MSYSDQAGYLKYFPPLSQAVAERTYKNLIELKKIGPPFPSSIKGLLGQIELDCKMGYGKMVKDYLEFNLGDHDMEMMMDSLRWELNPQKIANDRLYPISGILKIIRVSFNSKKLRELLKKEGKTEIYQTASRYYIPGKYIPHIGEFVKEIRSRKPGKHRYAHVGDEPFTYITDIMREIGILPHQLSNILEENTELRKMIYADGRGKRVVRTAEEEEFKENVKKTKEYKSHMQKNAIPRQA
jgi:hypothetical protein